MPLRLAILLICSLLPVAPAWADSPVEVVIEGVDGALAENVRAHLGFADLPAGASEGHVQRLYRRSGERVERALAALGHYHPDIERSLETTGDGWRVRYRIDPGPPVKVAAVAYTVTGPGADDPVLTGLADDLPVSEGATLRHPDFEAARSRIRNACLQRGYFDFQFTRSRLEIDLVADTARAILELDSGPRYRMGPVTFEQSTFDEGFLERFIPFAPGEPYHQRNLLELRRGLNDSGLFRRVEVEPQREAAEDGRWVPVTVTTEPRKRQRYRFGIGFGTDTGARALAGWGLRYVNDRGHQADTELRLSQVRTRFEATYTLPGRDPRNDQLALSLGYQDERVDDGRSETTTFDVRKLHQREDGWLVTRFLRFEEERYALGMTSRRTTLVLPGITLARTWGAERLRPRRGQRISLTLQGAHEALFSDTSLLQARMDAKAIRPLGERNRVLARVAAGGSVTSRFSDVPTSLRFFAGGDQSVRGFDYRALGPTDASGEVIGGAYLLAGSVELEHAFREQWAVAAFMDAGNAFDDPGTELETAAGVGLRWFSPVGPVRLDFASPLEQGKRGLRIHLHMGPDL